jgi:hypothetical protein
MKISIYSWIVLLSGLAIAQSPLRNEQWVIQTAQAEWKTFISGENIHRLRLEAEPGCGQYLPFMRYVLLQGLSADSLQITDNDSAAVLHFYQFGVRTEYLNRTSLLLSWHPELDRQLEITCSVGLVIPGQQNRLLEFTRYYTDRIRKSQKAEVESGLFPYFSGEIKPSGWWEMWLEPVLLTAGSAVFGYLLYSVRS